MENFCETCRGVFLPVIGVGGEKIWKFKYKDQYVSAENLKKMCCNNLPSDKTCFLSGKKV